MSIPSDHDASFVQRCIRVAFPHSAVQNTETLTGGLINTNIKVTFSSNVSPVVLRLYSSDPAICLKEAAIIEFVRQTVPVPRIFHVQPNGLEGSGPFSITEFVEGVTFQQLKRTNDLQAIHQAAISVGRTLAAIGSHKFPNAGRLFCDTNNELRVGDTYVEGQDPVPTILEMFLQSPNLQRRVDNDLRKQLHDFVWSWAPRLPTLEKEHHLVHSDFGKKNILIREVEGEWGVAAVLDWEFAFSGSPLLDVGHFLRYEKSDQPLLEPYFSRAFVDHGGSLPDNWREITRVIDLTGLVQSLTHRELPNEVVFKVLGLIRSTLDECRA